MVSWAELDLLQTSPPRGFSLLEVLIVLAVVSILLATTMLSFRQVESRKLYEEAERLSLLVSAVSDRAAMTSRRHRLSVSLTEVRVESHSRGEWVVLDDHFYRQRPWGSGVRPEAEMSWVFDEMGRVSPERSLSLIRAQDSLRLSINALGDVAIQRP